MGLVHDTGSETREKRRRRSRHEQRYRRPGLQPFRRLGHLPVRDGAGAAHGVAELRHAGDHHVAVLRGVRLGHRLAHDGGRRRELRRVHRARPDHAVDVHGEHLQRLVRHLLPEVHRHDLRDPVGAGVVPGDRAGLRGAAATKSIVLGLIILTTASFFVPMRIEHPLVMGGVPGADCLHLQPVRLHHRHLGQGVREPAVHPDAASSRRSPSWAGRSTPSTCCRPRWRTFSLFNPVVYIISGFRWSFYGKSDVAIEMSIAMTLGFFVACLAGGRVDLQDGLSAQELAPTKTSESQGRVAITLRQPLWPRARPSFAGLRGHHRL